MIRLSDEPHILRSPKQIVRGKDENMKQEATLKRTS